MAHINQIRFNRVSANEGCTCDRCGQYIRNIWTVDYIEGIRMNYGIDCFEKILKQGLNQQGTKSFKKVLKSIERYEDQLSRYTSGELTAETDESYKAEQSDWNKNSYWYGRSFEEYKDWLINEFYPYRISEKQKELARFRKINFKEV